MKAKKEYSVLPHKINFHLPRYKKGQRVMSPDGPGIIDHMKYIGGTWYFVGGKYYSEAELHP